MPVAPDAIPSVMKSPYKDALPPSPVRWMIGVGGVIWFAASSARHLLFESGAFDLGYFDQAAYLVSQGLSPIVSFWGYHFMGGHADPVVYLLALFYKIYPSVYWLLGLQAIALCLAPWPTWCLARQAGLHQSLAIAVAAAAWLYPLVFNLNSSDFHPEVLAFPAILVAVWAARAQRLVPFVGAVVFSLSCRDALSLTVAAMGLWLLAFEQRRIYGAIALGLGSAWFLVATQLVIPTFRPGGVEAVGRYAYLGDSLTEIILNLFLKPWLLFSQIFSGSTVEYMLFLLLPLAWGLSWRHLAPLVSAIPQLAMNILADYPPMRYMIHQYTLPILPFLLLAVIASLANGKGLIQTSRWIWLWLMVAFLAFANHGYLRSLYLSYLDTSWQANWQASRAAIALIPPHTGRVLAPHNLVPHLTHRPEVYFTQSSSINNLDRMDYVLLNQRHPGFGSSPEIVAQLVNRLDSDRQFQRRYEQDGVLLFVHQLNPNT